MWSYLSQDANTLGCAKSISLTGINKCLVFPQTYISMWKSTHALSKIYIWDQSRWAKSSYLTLSSHWMRTSYSSLSLSSSLSPAHTHHHFLHHSYQLPHQISNTFSSRFCVIVNRSFFLAIAAAHMWSFFALKPHKMQIQHNALIILVFEIML